MPTVGDTIAGYRLARRLGGGGSGEVYLVERAGHPDVALKLSRSDGADANAVQERFEREYATAAAIAGPHVVVPLDRGRSQLYRSGERIGEPRAWMTTEYIDGRPATDLVPRRDPPDVTDVVQTLLDVAAALDRCHRAGILHRDVKPGNILVAGTGITTSGFLTDFGTAQPLTPPRAVMWGGRLDFSLSSAAPELLAAQDLSPQTDGYAFAATAYELLTGRTPYRGSTPAAIRYARLRSPVPPLDRIQRWLPRSLNSVFVKALAERAEDRYASCEQLADVVRRSLRGIDPPAPRRRR